MRPHARRVLAPAHRQPVPLDAAFEGAIDGLQKILAMRLNVEADDVGAQHAVQQFLLPRADFEGLGIRPRDVPEHRDARVRPRFLDEPRQEGEVVVLHEDDRPLDIVHLVEHGVGELPVHLPVVLPVVHAEDRTRVRDVAQRPESFVREAEVVALFFLGGQPHAPQRVPRAIGRHANAPSGVDHLAIRVAGGVRDPGAVARHEHRLERRDDAARRHHGLDVPPATHVLVRLAVRHDDEPRAAQAFLHADPQPLGGPQRIRRLAQARLGFGAGLRRREALRQARRLGRNRIEQASRLAFGARRDAPEPQIAHPAGRPRNRRQHGRLHDEVGDDDNQEDLRDHEDQRVAPHPARRAGHHAGVKEHGEQGRGSQLALEGRRVRKERAPGQGHELAASLRHFASGSDGWMPARGLVDGAR